MSIHRHGSISSQASDSRHAHQLLQNVGRTIQRTSSQLRKSKAYHLLYLVMLPTYTVCGAVLFKWLDGEHDEQQKMMYQNRCTGGREERLAFLKGQCKQSPDDCYELMKTFALEVDRCYRDWHTVNRTITHSMANFSNALIYAFSVYTTIGYGNVAADTTACRIATIFYGVLGIPLFFAFVKEEGNLCRIFFIHLYKKAKLLRKKCFKKCTTNESSSSQEQITNGNCLGVPSPTFGGPSQAESGEITPKTTSPVKIHRDARWYTRQPSSNSLHECDRNERRKVFAAGCVTLIAYVLIASFIVHLTTEFDYITSVYFLFNSVALIGFGDVFPSTPTVILVHAPFMLFGVILFSMCYFIMQEEIRDRTFEASRRARISISKYGQSIINQARSPWSRRNSPLFDNNSENGGGTNGPSPSSFERMRKRRQSAPAIALTNPTGKTARFRDI
ncbi:hypothetical protein PMAYCL1PPCAC_30423 [Pristionchus mayeri]|uniref:Potassium channel domain-containing protein n=1 Tax=Pristionchus mayeri TaxID=1317129 RepID=A0AAN5DB02_9BILA|nr:hypothetical protein PMAYCL1PPCAC_30423 [Pristionchus mayeri]